MLSGPSRPVAPRTIPMADGETAGSENESIRVVAMKAPRLAFIAVAGLLAGVSCQRADQDAARERAQHYEKEAEAAARRLGQDARELGAKVNEKAHEVGATGQSGPGETPGQKLRRGAAELKREGKEAGAKLSQAGQGAKGKYNLSAALGFSAASQIEVDSKGNTITLRGSVANPDGRAEAERVALGTDGVTKVVNELRVKQ